MVQNKAKKSWFSVRKGILLVITAPLIFILSGLFLANTLVNPPESLAYQIGKVICFIFAPAIFILGIATCIKAHINKRAVKGEMPPKPVVKKEHRKKEHKEPMPPWLVWMRRALAISLFIWCATVTILYGPAAIIFGVGPQVLIVLIVATYAFSKRRGAFGTAIITLLSASVFATLIAAPLGLLFGCIPLGVPELIGDWMAGRDPDAVGTLLLVVKASLLLSTGLAVLASFLLGLKRLRKFEARRITKILTVCIVLLPIAVACLVPGQRPGQQNQPSNIIKESEVEIIYSPDKNVTLSFSSVRPLVPTQRTIFTSGETIYPCEEGLPKGTVFAFRIIDSNGKVIIPLDQWPYTETRVGYGSEGCGWFNTEKEPMAPGDYTLQLVKIDKPNKKAFIIAEKNFSIESKYTKEELSNLQAWIVLGEDPNSTHYETLHFKGSTSFSVWVQTTGYSVSGKATMSRILPDSGEKDSSFYREFSFTTDSAGKPIRVFSFSGSWPSGNYPIEIIVEGKVIKRLMVSW